MRHLIIILLLTTFSLMAAERIITLSPSLSEIVYALGAGETIVGVSDYANYPKAVQKITKVGGYFQPNIEAILALRPTLVVAQPHHKELLRKLKHLGIETLSLKLERLGDIKQTITRLGERLGHTLKASQLVTQITTASATVPKSTLKPKVLIVFGIREELRDGIYIAGHNIFYEEIIELCGGRNAFESDFSGQPALNYEGLIALNPDRVILLYSELTDSHMDPEYIKMIWQQVPIRAAEHNRITVLKGAYLSIPSHRIAQTISTLCAEIARD